MNISIRKTLYNKSFLKVSSLIIAYFLWLSISQSLPITNIFEVPLYFYNTKNCSIKAPETITLLLKGRRQSFNNLDKESLGLYYDAQKLPQGKSPLFLEQNYVNYPQITIQQHIPSIIYITVTKTA